MQVTQLNLYPIKSARAYGVEQAVVLPQGLNFDREFMITETDGKFITARKEAVLYQISALPIREGVVIEFNGEQCVARYADFIEAQSCEVWGTVFPSKVAADCVNQWLSEIFQRPVQLRWLGEQSSRLLDNSAEHPMSFGDSNPVLLCSEKSLQQLQAWSPVAVNMGQFRANIVIDGDVAFEEEAWREIKIGTVEFSFARHCTRCIMITRDLNTYLLDEKAEPFRTLKQQHTNENGKPIFGVHLVPKNSGIIRLGDSIHILK